MHFRSFRNADPPHLAALWQSCEPQTGLRQGVDCSMLEDVVFSKRYFNPDGLIVAENEGRIVGFVHAGLGLNKARTALSRQRGVISMLIVAPKFRRQGIGTALLHRGERFLAEQGVRTVQIGEWGRLAPFYTGIYGQSLCPGILANSPAVAFCRATGFEARFETRLLELDLGRFRSPVDRKLLQVRRTVDVQCTYDPIPADWWEACKFGVLERVLFELSPRTGGPAKVRSLFWYHTSDDLGQVSLVSITSDPESRRLGWGTFLLSEALKHLQGSGFESVAALCRATNQPVQGLLKKLGFREVNRGIVFRKPMPANALPITVAKQERPPSRRSTGRA